VMKAKQASASPDEDEDGNGRPGQGKRWLLLGSSAVVVQWRKGQRREDWRAVAAQLPPAVRGGCGHGPAHGGGSCYQR
jgi:hypothetical protein